MNLPKTIEVTFEADDLKNAESYMDCRDCLLATALHRMGHEVVFVGGAGRTTFFPEGLGGPSFNYEPSKYFGSETAEDDDAPANDPDNPHGYNKKLIGQTITLRRES